MSDGKKKDKKKLKKEKQQAKVIQEMNYETCYTSFLIDILAEYCQIEFITPHTRATKTLQFPNINKITISDEIILFDELISKRIELRAIVFRKDCSEERTIKRRCQATRRQEIIHLLEDFLYILGTIVIVEEYENQRMYYIKKDEKWITLTYDEMFTKGEEITKMIDAKIISDKKFVYIK